MSRTCQVILIVVTAVLFRASLAGAAAPEPCGGESKALCGSVSVPLDRSQPSGEKIEVKFQVFRHSGSAQPAEGTIFVTEGGPGYSVLNNAVEPYSDFLFGPLLDHRDLVLIDQRGVGQSGAIDCQPLQLQNSDIYSAVAKCGEQLGASADRYGSPDVADDVEAVRASLGVEKFDFYGGSYAGMDIQAYAARYPERLRSVVLDSPVVLSGEDEWFTLGAAQLVTTVEHVCGRSAACSAANRDPGADVARLAQRLRKTPVKGTGHDADGVASRQRVTETQLVHMLGSTAGGAIVQGEIAAAARALSHGDRAPLLRLSAENSESVFSGESEDPTLFSMGLNSARFCTDITPPWDKQASPAQRRTQYDEARAALSPDRFAPFSVDAWLAPPPVGAAPDPCIDWPAPTHELTSTPPPGTVVPDVPALVITGDLDLSVPPAESLHATEMFPRSTVVDLAESGHHVVFNAQADCAGEIVRSFVSTLDAGDTGCSRKPAYKFPGVGRFPLRVTSRKAAARTAADTLLDGLRRTFMASDQEKPSGAGLRGGKFRGRFFDDRETLHLERARFARNLAVTGNANWKGYVKLSAKLKLRGVVRGTVRVRGTWNNPAATKLTITGRIDGRRVKATIPGF